MIKYGWNLCLVLFHHVFAYVTMNPGNCTFDYNICGWTLYPHNLWTLDADNGNNYYLVLNSHDWQTQRLLLESVPLEATGLQCLTFDYRTRRRTPAIRFSADLNVSLVNDCFEHHLVYLQEGNYDNIWQRFFLNVDNVQNYMDTKIRFSASVTTWEDMNLDNIQLFNGSCRFECNFENDLCGITNDNFQRIDYTGEWPVHTRNTVRGHYLYLKGIQKSATLENIIFFLYDFQCITFWYRIYGETSRISVIVEDTKNKTTLRNWIKWGKYIDTWFPAAIDAEVRKGTLVQIRISGLSSRYYSNIGLDNIAITSLSCLDCNFRDGFCNWDQISTWRITSNGSKYAYPLCNEKNESALISRSEVVQGEKCLSLFHFIENMYIEVRTQDERRPNTIWNNIGEKERTMWKTTHININLTTPSQIAIRVKPFRRCSGIYFISSISLKQGRCKEHTTISVPGTTINTPCNTCYTSIRTTSARQSTSTAFTTATAPTATTTTTTTAQTTSYSNRTKELNTENAALQMTEEGSSKVSTGVIIGIVIGCLVLAGAVSLVAVYMYRRRHVSNTQTKIPSKGTLRSRSFSQILKTKKEDKSSASSIEKNAKCNITSESAYYNVQAEYATVEKKIQPHKHSKHISGSADECVYSLAGSLPDTDFTIVSHAVEIEGINRENVSTENNYQYDTVYEMRKALTDSTYNHTNEVQVDAYASTIPSPITPLDETYSQLECKSDLDNIYSNTNITDVSTHSTFTKSSDQDLNHIYNNTVVD